MLLGAGVVLAVPSFIDRRAIAVMFAWNLLLLMAWALDLRRIQPGSLDVTRAAEELGWKPRYDIRAGLAATLQAVQTTRQQ